MHYYFNFIENYNVRYRVVSSRTATATIAVVPPDGSERQRWSQKRTLEKAISTTDSRARVDISSLISYAQLPQASADIINLN